MRDDRFRAGGKPFLAAAAMLLGLTAAPSLARAQFFWEQPRITADDAARSAMAHGFRVLSRPERNDDVYVAQVIDRRGAREQLIIAADSGEILQRFAIDPVRGYQRYGDPTIEPGPMPPGRIPTEDRQPGLLSKLFGNDDAAPPPAPETDGPFAAPDRAPRPPRIRHPRVVDRSLDVPRPSPVESAPLAPPGAAPVLHPHLAPPAPTRPAPVQAILPPAAPAAAAPDRPVRVINTNPLAIPGSREQDEKASARPADATAAAAPARAAAPVKPLVPKPPVAPASAAPAKEGVPVVPLE